jgi:DNA repair protein RadA/Sms
MAKTQTVYVCQNCGRQTPKEMGRCPQCNQFNTFKEEIRSEPKRATKPRGLSGDSQPQRLSEIKSDVADRIHLNIAELARVLGGGIVPGSIILVGGDPGIGKSTLLLQAALELAEKQTVLYVSGEESENQIKMRSIRLLEEDANIPDKLLLVTETNLEVVEQHVQQTNPGILIIDSIQTIYTADSESSAGSVSQVRECASRFRELAKKKGVVVFLIGHVTKEGVIAGPRVLEHIVDTVLYLEGDRYGAYRLLRSVKNRFGPTSEVGVFEMREKGMIEVPNPSESFLAERIINAAGSAVVVTMEGTRPLLVEVQGLTSKTASSFPRRNANGVDFNRLLLITAVLSRRVGVKLFDQDIFANIVGGLKVNEPAADLALAAALASSVWGRPVLADTILIGEIGLSGELRQVGQLAARLREASNLGFKRAIIPLRRKQQGDLPKGMEIVEVRTLRKALDESLMRS